jgi:predicted transcriptional regulator
MATYKKTYYEGKTPETIAYELGVSSQTVKTYLKEIEGNVSNYESDVHFEELMDNLKFLGLILFLIFLLILSFL